jgi:hypothetical protein
VATWLAIRYWVSSCEDHRQRRAACKRLCHASLSGGTAGVDRDDKAQTAPMIIIPSTPKVQNALPSLTTSSPIAASMIGVAATIRARPAGPPGQSRTKDHAFTCLLVSRMR